MGLGSVGGMYEVAAAAHGSNLPGGVVPEVYKWTLVNNNLLQYVSAIMNVLDIIAAVSC